MFCIKCSPDLNYSWDLISPYSPPPQITDHYCHSLVQIQADSSAFSQYLSLRGKSPAWRTSPQKFKHRYLWEVWTWHSHLCILLKSSGVSLPCYCKVLSCLSTNEGGCLGRNQEESKQGSLNISSIYSQQNCLPQPWAGTADLSRMSKAMSLEQLRTVTPTIVHCRCVCVMSQALCKAHYGHTII